MLAAVSSDGYERAGRLGVGILGMTMLTPFDTMRELFGHYERGLEQCTPSGSRVNDQRSVFTFLHCAESEQAAIDSRAAEAALWFVNQSPRLSPAAHELDQCNSRNRAHVLPGRSREPGNGRERRH
jgi:hypothetical protein